MISINYKETEKLESFIQERSSQIYGIQKFMKLPIKNSPKNLFDKISKGLLFCSLAIFSGSVCAQNINDDLQPKKTTTKTSTRKTVSTKRSVKRTTPAVASATRASASFSQSPAQILDRFANYRQSAGVTTRDWQSVVAQSTSVLQSNPNDVMAKFQLAVGQGQLAYRRGDYSNALTQFNSAAQLLSNSAIPFYCIGEVYLATRQPNEAKDNFEKATKLNGNFALGYRGLGDVLAGQGKTKPAQEYYAQAARLGGAYGNVRASNYARRNVKVQQTARVNSASQISSYDSQINVAKSLTARKKWQASLNILNPLSRNSQSPDLFLAIGDNYSGMKQWLSAQQAYQKAINLSPNSAPALYKMGMVMYQTNEFEAASAAFEKALILDQNGTTINRKDAREMADKASEKAKEVKTGKKRKFLGIGIG